TLVNTNHTALHYSAFPMDITHGEPRCFVWPLPRGSRDTAGRSGGCDRAALEAAASPGDAQSTVRQPGRAEAVVEVVPLLLPGRQCHSTLDLRYSTPPRGVDLNRTHFQEPSHVLEPQPSPPSRPQTVASARVDRGENSPLRGGRCVPARTDATR